MLDTIIWCNNIPVLNIDDCFRHDKHMTSYNLKKNQNKVTYWCNKFVTGKFERDMNVID